MAKPTVYIETTIISYLTARMSRDIITAADQKLTQDWWEDRRTSTTYISHNWSCKRSAGAMRGPFRNVGRMPSGLPILAVTEVVDDLASALVSPGTLPDKASVDAAHLAVAAVNGIDYLLTWNCKHLANATIHREVERICRAFGYGTPLVCTPQELLGEEPYVD